MPDDIELVDDKGRKVTVTRAHWNRWPSLRDTFRPVAEKPTTSVVTNPAPTGVTKEN